MNKSEFIRLFKLAPLNNSTQQFNYHLISNKPLRPAAVLIAVTWQNNQLEILLTKRAEHLRHHAGQISFPGGKAEEQDSDLTSTAIREFEEEVGINANQVEVIGHLKPYQTISGFEVLPVVAFLTPPLAAKIDENEVSEVFYLPLQHCLNQENHLSVATQIKNQHHQVTFIPYQQYNIWGATASMLKDFALHIINARA